MTDTDFPRADQVRRALLDALLPEAAFDGWTAKTLARAAKAAGIEAGEVRLVCSGGVLDLIETWSLICDAAAADEIAETEPPKRIREKIAQAVMIRLSQAAGEEEAAVRARERLLLPDAAGLGPKLLWATADTLWRAIGDTSTDGNYYSKRAILSGVFASTATVWMKEADPDKPETRAFLERRIEGVMQFEKVKAQARQFQSRFPDLTAMAARMRYGFGRGT